MDNTHRKSGTFTMASLALGITGHVWVAVLLTLGSLSPLQLSVSLMLLFLLGALAVASGVMALQSKSSGAAVAGLTLGLLDLGAAVAAGVLQLGLVSI